MDGFETSFRGVLKMDIITYVPHLQRTENNNKTVEYI